MCLPHGFWFHSFSCGARGRCTQVLFLDSDNVAVADPTPLFQAPAFQNTGALLWPDYWASTAAPDLAAILGLDALPRGTHESGQMLFSKRRCMLAAARSLCCWQPCLACVCRQEQHESQAHDVQRVLLRYVCCKGPI